MIDVDQNGIVGMGTVCPRCGSRFAICTPADPTPECLQCVSEHFDGAVNLESAIAQYTIMTYSDLIPQ